MNMDHMNPTDIPRRLNGWQRLWIVVSAIWLAVVCVSAYESLDHQRFAVLFDEAKPPVPVFLLKDDLLSPLESLLLTDSSRVKVAQIQRNVKSGEFRALLNHTSTDWHVAIEQPITAWMVVSVLVKACGPWFASSALLYVFGYAVSWTITGFRNRNPATISGKPAIAKRAIMSQASKDGNTILHFAAAGDNIDLVKTLLRDGAEVNAQNTLGQTPLHTAFKHRKLEIAVLLATHGADPTIIDGDGNTPHDLDKSAV